ncbi:hypothetical protein A2X44_03495 [candidate division CPR3 bacterium GWF2_35_18]|uniref:Minus agglutinin n=1 Tax=candidate division CPR3 bacterium GW2011_GWF2_35_18 TaxID=1618350 RepID=A0A0G0C0C5_UNCC3|nr:MAG: hypothetical protein UR67_C0005G0060 [candidate division CPR3 bacterium GW2011_GWF2_35_18]OGB63044.1 MAG: hypothetical protein A2X44_03495 [candidate division CPR3 bacterium GWF2_35_18]OGB63932.1 MAG: hypothetical protein A2250_02710 [candidate division CPR3 bacterium RIFOXYA2_FULL_35_13]
MRAHPIPQNVVSFEDRIFGPLTAKQFSIIATGLSFAFVLYMSPLPGTFKIPAVVVVSLFSFAAGLVRINDMTLDTWLTTFIGAIYSPTQFIWQKTTEEFVSFLQLAHTKSATTKAKESRSATEKTKKDLYPELFSEERQDEKEQEFLSQLNFEIPTPQNIPQAIETKSPIEKTAILNIPVEKPQPKEVFKETVVPLQQTTLNKETPPVKIFKEVKPSILKKETIAVAPKLKTIKPEIEGYPERRQAPSTSKVKGVTPLASEINFTNKPVFTLKISGQEPQYVQGLSNLKVNRAIHKVDQAQTIFPVKGERHFEVSSDFEKRFNQDDLEVKNLDILKIEGEPETKKVMPLIKNPEQSKPIQTNIKPNVNSIPQKQTSSVKENILPQKTVLTPPKQGFTEKPKGTLTPLPIKKISSEEKLILPVLEDLKPTPKPLTPEEVTPIKPVDVLEEETLINKVAFVPTVSQTSAPSQKPVFNFKSKDFMPPQIPNIIAGLIKDQNGSTLSNAIVLIKDENSTPVRALKTNKLGQFSIATPLPNGEYKLEMEKEGCQFKIIDLELKGELIPLLEIVGTTA